MIKIGVGVARGSALFDFTDVTHIVLEMGHALHFLLVWRPAVV